MTVLIFVLALALGCLFAAGLSFLRTSEYVWFRRIGTAAAFLTKATPLYPALLLWYYTFLGGMHRGGLLIAVIVFGFYAGGHLSDILSRGIRKEMQSRNAAVNRRARKEFFTALLPPPPTPITLMILCDRSFGD